MKRKLKQPCEIFNDQTGFAKNQDDEKMSPIGTRYKKRCNDDILKEKDKEREESTVVRVVKELVERQRRKRRHGVFERRKEKIGSDSTKLASRELRFHYCSPNWIPLPSTRSLTLPTHIYLQSPH